MFIIGSLVPSFFLDRLGRRNPMMLGAAGCGVSMMLISILLSFKDNSNATLAQNTAFGAVAFFFVVRIRSCPRRSEFILTYDSTCWYLAHRSIVFLGYMSQKSYLFTQEPRERRLVSAVYVLLSFHYLHTRRRSIQ